MDIHVLQFGLLITVGAFFSLVARLLKQPPLLGYLVTGVVLGPVFLGYITNQSWLGGVNELSAILLLFLVGLELDWTKAKTQINTTFAISCIQVLGSFAAGFACASLLGTSLVTGIYLGSALAFSSTVIVIKLLSDSRDLHSLHGRLAVGILLFEDLVATIAIVLLHGLALPSNLGLDMVILLLASKTIALVALLWMSGHYLLPYLFARIARSTELLFVCSLAWCFTITLITTEFGFPSEIGALLAGISLASLPYSLDITNRLRSVRDCSAIILFVILGSRFVIPEGHYLLLGITFLILTTIGKPVISYILLNLRGYKNRTSFMTALTQGQVSELSLLIVAAGATYHQLPDKLVDTALFTVVSSLCVSIVLLSQRDRLYHWFRPLLKKFERRNPSLDLTSSDLHDHIVIFGYHRMGYHILKKVKNRQQGVVVVDFNPDIIKKLTEQNVQCVYGDIQDEDILEVVEAKAAAVVISTVPHREETMFLIDRLAKLTHKPFLIVTSHYIDDALDYYKEGADYVILPHMLGGEHVGDLIAEHSPESLQALIASRADELKSLRTNKRHALYYD